MRLNIRLLSFITYFGYFLIGIVSFIISPTLPLIIEDFGISVGIAGSIFSVIAMGVFLGAVSGGYVSDIIGKKAAIIIGCLFQLIGFSLIATTRNWILGLCFVFIIGLGRGFLNTSFNALISDIYSNKRGAALNTLHGIYGVGSLIGPMLAGIMISLDYEWRVVYYGAALIWLIYVLIIMPIRYPSASYVFTGKENKDNIAGRKNSIREQNTTDSEGKEKGESVISQAGNNTDKKQKRAKIASMSVKSIISDPVFIMLCFVSFIYNGVATGLVGWINTYLDGINFPVLLGSSMVSIFYLGLTIGRFSCTYLSEKIGYLKTILICALGCFIFYPFAIFASIPVIIAAGIFFSGLFFSGLHPTALAYANSNFPFLSGTITGLLSTAMSFGAMIIPWLIGLIAEKQDFKVGFGINYIFIVILVGVAVSLLLRERKKSINITY